ncbi:hypothetical protein GQ44DRAFT_455667 [Phaeosphaeriaceae sp. PMI808]|nr:hypothetical protein GQ44DRAFT_455667 [Phaeosphaeriaceae sp. PMI808]
MATSFDTFRVQTPSHFRFIPYYGPPTSKPSSQRSPLKKILPVADGWHAIDEMLRIGVESNVAPLKIEVVDLTDSDSGVNDVSSGNVDDHGNSDLCSQGERENAQCKQSGPPENVAAEKMDRSLNQPTIAEHGQDLLTSLKKCIAEPNTGTHGCSSWETHNMQMDDELEGSGFSSLEIDNVYQTATEDAADSEEV